jgi:hypothetical protein
MRNVIMVIFVGITQFSAPGQSGFFLAGGARLGTLTEAENIDQASNEYLVYPTAGLGYSFGLTDKTCFDLSAGWVGYSVPESETYLRVVNPDRPLNPNRLTYHSNQLSIQGDWRYHMTNARHSAVLKLGFRHERSLSSSFSSEDYVLNSSQGNSTRTTNGFKTRRANIMAAGIGYRLLTRRIVFTIVPEAGVSFSPYLEWPKGSRLFFYGLDMKFTFRKAEE